MILLISFSGSQFLSDCYYIVWKNYDEFAIPTCQPTQAQLCDNDCGRMTDSVLQLAILMCKNQEIYRITTKIQKFKSNNNYNFSQQTSQNYQINYNFAQINLLYFMHIYKIKSSYQQNKIAALNNMKLFIIKNQMIQQKAITNTNTNISQQPPNIASSSTIKHSHKYAVPTNIPPRSLQHMHVQANLNQQNLPTFCYSPRMINQPNTVTPSISKQQAQEKYKFSQSLGQKFSYQKDKDKDKANYREADQHNNTLAKLLMFQSNDHNSRDYMPAVHIVSRQYYTPNSQQNSNSSNKLNISNAIKYVSSRYQPRMQAQYNNHQNSQQKNRTPYIQNYKQNNQYTQGLRNFASLPLYQSQYQYTTKPRQPTKQQQHAQPNKKQTQTQNYQPADPLANQRQNNEGHDLELSQSSGRRSSKSKKQRLKKQKKMRYIDNVNQNQGNQADDKNGINLSDQESSQSFDPLYNFIIRLASSLSRQLRVVDRYAFQAIYINYKHNKEKNSTNNSRNNIYNNPSSRFKKYGNIQQTSTNKNQYAIAQPIASYSYNNSLKNSNSYNNQNTEDYRMQERYTTKQAKPGQQQLHALSSISSIQLQSNSHNMSITLPYSISTSINDQYLTQLPRRKHVFTIQNQFQPTSSPAPSTSTSTPMLQQQHKYQKKYSSSNQYPYLLHTFHKITQQQQQQSNTNTNSNIASAANSISGFHFNANLKTKHKAKAKSRTKQHNKHEGYHADQAMKQVVTTKQANIINMKFIAHTQNQNKQMNVLKAVDYVPRMDSIVALVLPLLQEETTSSLMNLQAYDKQNMFSVAKNAANSVPLTIQSLLPDLFVGSLSENDEICYMFQHQQPASKSQKKHKISPRVNQQQQQKYKTREFLQSQGQHQPADKFDPQNDYDSKQQQYNQQQNMVEEMQASCQQVKIKMEHSPEVKGSQAAISKDSGKLSKQSFQLDIDSNFRSNNLVNKNVSSSQNIDKVRQNSIKTIEDDKIIPQSVQARTNAQPVQNQRANINTNSPNRNIVYPQPVPIHQITIQQQPHIQYINVGAEIKVEKLNLNNNNIHSSYDSANLNQNIIRSPNLSPRPTSNISSIQMNAISIRNQPILNANFIERHIIADINKQPKQPNRERPVTYSPPPSKLIMHPQSPKHVNFVHGQPSIFIPSPFTKQQISQPNLINISPLSPRNNQKVASASLNKSPHQVKINNSKNIVPGQRKVFITYQNNPNNPPIIIRPVSQPNLRPVSSFNRNIPQPLITDTESRYIQNEKIKEIRNNYYIQQNNEKRIVKNVSPVRITYSPTPPQVNFIHQNYQQKPKILDYGHNNLVYVEKQSHLVDRKATNSSQIKIHQNIKQINQLGQQKARVDGKNLAITSINNIKQINNEVQIKNMQASIKDKTGSVTKSIKENSSNRQISSQRDSSNKKQSINSLSIQQRNEQDKMKNSIICQLDQVQKDNKNNSEPLISTKKQLATVANNTQNTNFKKPRNNNIYFDNRISPKKQQDKSQYLLNSINNNNQHIVPQEIISPSKLPFSFGSNASRPIHAIYSKSPPQMGQLIHSVNVSGTPRVNSPTNQVYSSRPVSPQNQINVSHHQINTNQAANRNSDPISHKIINPVVYQEYHDHDYLYTSNRPGSRKLSIVSREQNPGKSLKVKPNSP